MAIKLEDIQDLVDETLGMIKSIEEEEVDMTEVVEPSTDVEYPEPPEWEDHPDFPGVQTRVVDAGYQLGIPSLTGLTVQTYSGFETTCPIPVPPIPEVYEPNVEQMRALLVATNKKLLSLHTGHTGSGKTSGIEYFCAMTGRPFHRQECDMFTDDQKLFGTLELNDGKTYHNKSDLVRSIAYPAICCLDEMNALPSATQMACNPLTDRRQVRITSHDDEACETLTAHDEWVIVATSNTNGSSDGLDLYNSANVQDQAMINRVALFVDVPYPSESAERNIIKKLAPDMEENEVKLLAKFSQLMHKAFENRDIGTAFSIRNLQVLCTLMPEYTLKEALEVNFFNRVSESDLQYVTETSRSVFGR